MKKFIVQLVSNRLGIFLAALNICYFVSENSNFFRAPFGKIFLSANTPAGITALLSVEVIKLFAHNIDSPEQMALTNVLFFFFCIVQWLFIAWIAKTLAAKFRPKEL